MGHRIGLLILGFASVLAANGVVALGLGDITLKSHLNQQLEAEIELLEVRELTKDEVLINLGSPEAFERQGIERTYFLTDLKFEVVLDAKGGPVVRLTSTRPVREPFIDFILEAHWPSGKLLREYTLLLDLPLFSDDASAPVSAVQTETLSQSSSRNNRPKSQSSNDSAQYNPRSSFESNQPSNASTNRAPTTSTTPNSSSDSYRVERNDTLWEIALDVRSDGGLSVHQVMMALHKANPDAFINGNINMLKSGQILRVPDREQMQALNNRQAVREVAQHNADWTGKTNAAPLEASRSSLNNDTQESYGEGRLSLAATENVYDAAQGRVSGSGSGANSSSLALETELNATQETLDKTQGENQELRSKIGSLEEQIRTLESMIEVSNDNLRALEIAAAAEENINDEAALIEPPQVDVAESDTVEPVEGEDAVVAFNDTDTELDIESDATEDASGSVTESIVESPEEIEKVEPVKKVDSTKVVISAPKKSFNIVDFIMEYIIFIGLFVVALLGAIFFFVKQRNDNQEDFDDFLGDSAGFEDAGYDAFEENDEDDESELASEGVAEELLDDVSNDEPEEALEPETEDVVAESDIYIAYGKYDQAEEMLLKALTRNPNHNEARLKLLEIYATQENLESFDPHYAALRSGSTADSLIARASELRKGISGADDFNESLYTTDEFEAVNADSEDELPLDDEITDSFAIPEEDSSFELDLDDEKSAAEGDFDLDLDLSDDVLTAGDDLELDLMDSDDDSLSDSPKDNDIAFENEFNLEGLDFEVPDDDESTANSIELDISDDDLNVESASGIDLQTGFDEIGTDLKQDDSTSEFDELSLDVGDGDNDIEFDLDLDSFGVDDAESLEDDVEGLETDIAADATLSDDLDLDLEGIDLELNTDESFDLETNESVAPANPLDVLDEPSEEDTGLSLDIDDEREPAEDFDLADFDKELDLDLPETDKSDDDITVIRDAVTDLDKVDELSLTGSSFDLAALDEELEALTADLDDETSENDFSDVALDAELAVSDASLGESDDGFDAFDDLEIPDIDMSGLEEPKVDISLEEPDIDFGDLDLPSVEDDTKLEAPKPDFDESPDVASSSIETEKVEPTSQALDFELPDIDPDSADDEDLDFLSDGDETATKLDLAAAYIDMGDMTGAKEIIEEVIKEGTAEQQSEANKLLSKMDA